MRARARRWASGSARNSVRSRAEIGAVAARDDPGRRALEQDRRPARGWICGTNWIAEAPVPIDGDALPRQIVAVVPARRVEHRPREAVEAGDARERRLARAAPRRARGRRRVSVAGRWW